MAALFIEGVKALLVELAGVGALTGILYLYWNLMTKENGK